MQNIVTFIQNNVLRDRSKILTPILTNLFNGILLEVYDFHNWRFLQKNDTKTLATDTTDYNFSGENQDLGKIVEMLYGDDYLPLDEYDVKEFYRRVHNNVDGTTPFCFVPLNRPNQFTWNVKIYPCAATSLDSISYWYMKTLKPSDFNLFPNPMVFVDGTLWRYFTNEKKYKKARDFRDSYFLGRELMKQGDSPTVHRRSKIVSSDERLRVVAERSRLRTLRRR